MVDEPIVDQPSTPGFRPDFAWPSRGSQTHLDAQIGARYLWPVRPTKTNGAAVLGLLAVLCASSGAGLAQSESERPRSTVRLVEESWPDGSLRERKQVLVHDDGTTVDHGSFERWHDNGEKEYEAVFLYGKKEGTTVRYHKNGRRASQQEYKDGQRHGVSLSWDDSGEKVKEENWFEGKPHGSWTVWQDGKIKWRHAYEHGVPAPISEKPSS